MFVVKAKQGFSYNTVIAVTQNREQAVNTAIVIANSVYKDKYCWDIVLVSEYPIENNDFNVEVLEIYSPDYCSSQLEEESEKNYKALKNELEDDFPSYYGYGGIS